MKKTFNTLSILSMLSLMIIAFVSCDEDFTNLESDIDIIDNFNTDVAKYAVRAYTKKIERVQTNGLPIGLLGVYNDPFYGITTSNFVGQITPNILDPTFGENVVLDSVILSIPYFSSLIDTDSEGNSTYELDSIYGEDPIKLSIFRSNFFLRDFSTDDNIDFDEGLVYFSDGMTSEGNQINEVADIQGDLLYEKEGFTPSAEQITLYDSDNNITSRSAPALRIRLDDPDTNIWQPNDYWKTTILDKEGEAELSNANNFLNYFKGLYFKTESLNNLGNLFAFNIGSNASLTIYYTSDVVDPESEDEATEQNNFTLGFSGNRVNFFNTLNSPINDGDEINGDETLYLKGGEGSFAVIELFDLLGFDNNPDSDNVFEKFKKEFVEVNDNNSGNFVRPKRLVNEAYIKFYLDQDVNQVEPNRIYLYDIVNKNPIIDYFLDQTPSKTSHLEPIKVVNNNGISYKIRVTEYINNLLLRDSTNLKLGLVVSNNIISEGLTDIVFDVNTSNSELNVIPTNSIITPEGLVLKGSHPNVPEDLRVQLEIYYTEPEN